MTTIKNTRELPRDSLRCFQLSEEKAKQLATEYQFSWFYPAFENLGYLYVLESEHKEKKENE